VPARTRLPAQALCIMQKKKKKQVIFWLVWFRMFDSAALNTQIFSTAQVGV
jgi:hypothetical protein